MRGRSPNPAVLMLAMGLIGFPVELRGAPWTRPPPPRCRTQLVPQVPSTNVLLFTVQLAEAECARGPVSNQMPSFQPGIVPSVGSSACRYDKSRYPKRKLGVI